MVRAAPFQLTTELLMNPAPFTVRVKAAAPAVAPVGANEVIEGTGLAALMVKLALPDVPPPGDGLNTVTRPEPAEAMSAAVMAAWTWRRQLSRLRPTVWFRFRWSMARRHPSVPANIPSRIPAI